MMATIPKLDPTLRAPRALEIRSRRSFRGFFRYALLVGTSILVIAAERALAGEPKDALLRLEGRRVTLVQGTEVITSFVPDPGDTTGISKADIRSVERPDGKTTFYIISSNVVWSAFSEGSVKKCKSPTGSRIRSFVIIPDYAAVIATKDVIMFALLDPNEKNFGYATKDLTEGGELKSPKLRAREYEEGQGVEITDEDRPGWTLVIVPSKRMIGPAKTFKPK